MSTQKEICEICLGSRGQLLGSDCSHLFHSHCVPSTLLPGNLSCPICNSPWTRLPFGPPPPPVFADDEPLPLLEPASRAPLQDHGGITLKAKPELPALSRSESPDSFPILVSIRAPSLSLQDSDMVSGHPAPVDLVAVLDISSSMAGSKIELLKQAVGFVVDSMGPNDRFSIVTFSTESNRVTPLRRMTESGRSEAFQAINSLRSRGCTNIIAGLRTAVGVLEGRRQKNPVAGIMLLSDGMDTESPDFFGSLKHLHGNPTQVGEPRSEPVPMHTFGFGFDHDARALHAVAEGSGGTFNFIQSIDVIQDAFAQCIGGLLSVVAQEVEIRVRTGSSSVRIQSIPSGRHRHLIENNEQGGHQYGVIFLEDIYAEEEKQFLVYVSVPEETHGSKTLLIEVECSHKDPVSNQTVVSSPERVEIRRPETESMTEEDKRVSLEVDREKNRVAVTDAMAQAQAMADRGELDQARSLLRESRTNLSNSASAKAGDELPNWLEGELREMQEMMVSRAEYEFGGRAYMLSEMSSHLLQRASMQAPFTRRSHGLGYGAGNFSSNGYFSGMGYYNFYSLHDPSDHSSSYGKPRYSPITGPSYSENAPTFIPSCPIYSPYAQNSPVIYSPCSSDWSPRSPGYSPSSPSDSPKSPGYSPGRPNYCATSPTYSPSSPGFTPTCPGYSPSSPAYTPTCPGYSPPETADGPPPETCVTAMAPKWVGYQTSLMRQMVAKSQKLRQSAGQDGEQQPTNGAGN